MSVSHRVRQLKVLELEAKRCYADHVIDVFISCKNDETKTHAPLMGTRNSRKSRHINSMNCSAVRKTIDDLKQRGNLSGVDIANIVAVSKATVSRWSTGSATPLPKIQLILSDLRYVIDRLTEFYTPGETRVWLYARNELLGGKTAMELIHEGQTDEVLQGIERLDAITYL